VRPGRRSTVDVMHEDVTTHDGGAASKPQALVVQGRRIRPGDPAPQLRHEFTYSIIETPPRPSVASDKRRAERLRTRLRSGMLLDRRHKVIVDCLIQDRSRTGARLRLAQGRPLPKVFLLSDDVGKTQFWAQLAWQNGRDAGVRLVPI
jgi:hypothetical protein